MLLFIIFVFIALLLPFSARKVFSHPSEWNSLASLVVQRSTRTTIPRSGGPCAVFVHSLLRHRDCNWQHRSWSRWRLWFLRSSSSSEYIEKVSPEVEQPQEESSSSEATISDIMPPTNFLEIVAVRKHQREGESVSASPAVSDSTASDWPQQSPIVVVDDALHSPVAATTGSTPPQSSGSKIGQASCRSINGGSKEDSIRPFSCSCYCFFSYLCFGDGYRWVVDYPYAYFEGSVDNKYWHDYG